MEEKESFIFYRSFYNALQKVKDRNLRLDIFEAVCELGLNNNVKELNNEVGDVIMELISPQLEANEKRYQNGKKGGAPEGNQNARKSKNNSKTTQNNIENNYETTQNNLETIKNNQNNHRLNEKQPNVNVNDNDNLNENVNVNDNVTTTTKEEIKKENIIPTIEIKNLALIEFYEQHFGRTVSSTEVEILETWEDTELTRYAIKQAELARAFNIRYVQTILQSYETKNIKTVAEAEEAEKKFQESKTTIKNVNGFKSKFDKMEEEKQKFLEAHQDDL